MSARASRSSGCKERCARWVEDYDWRATERRLDAAPQFTTTMNGLADPLPARPLAAPRRLPAHPHPRLASGSVVEFLDVIPLLTGAGFDCVIPSLPGYGWSGKPSRPGLGRRADRPRVGGADGAARLRALWRTGHGLGHERERAPRGARSRARGRHPSMPPARAHRRCGRQADEDAGYFHTAAPPARRRSATR